MIVANSEGGWSTVKTQSGTEGLVPTDYLSLGDSRSAARSSQLPAKATVLYDFTGEVQEELSVKAGDAVVVRAETDGWFDVIRDADGAAGLVPASYLQLV